MMRQLAFDLGHRPALGRADFLVSGCNRLAVDLIDRWPDWDSSLLAICGPRAAGKSHLGAVWAGRAGAQMVAGHDLDPDAVPDLVAGGAVLVDGRPGTGGNETALFHLFNLLGEEGGSGLLIDVDPPARWQVSLPDLATRLATVSVAELAPPDDDLLAAVLVKHLADRQLDLSPRIVSYLTLRMERSFQAAEKVAARLDRMSLERKSKLTLGLAKAALEGDSGL